MTAMVQSEARTEARTTGKDAAAGAKGDRDSARAGDGDIVDELIDELVDRILAGETSAWTELTRHLHPMIIAVCPRGLGYGVDIDEVRRDVAQQVLGKLHAGDFARLRQYAKARQKYADMPFRAWLTVVTRNAYIDYLRRVPELQRLRDDGKPRLTVVQRQAFDDQSMSPPPQTDMATTLDVRRMMACIGQASFPAAQRQALSLWLAGFDTGEIAGEMALSGPGAAERLLRAARQRLRRAIRGGGGQ